MLLSRRELLRLFLGSGLAAAACRTNGDRTRKPLPEGEIVGQNVSLGHKIRENPGIITDSDFPEDKYFYKDIVIVGAGIAGLSAGYFLKKNGFENFQIIELEKQAGGTAQSGSSGNFSFPWGAHYLPVPLPNNQPLIELLGEMQLTEGLDAKGSPIIKEQYLCREPEERIFYKGRWYEGLYLAAGASARDKQEQQKFEQLMNYWASWRDSKNRRAFTLPVADCSDDAELKQLDQISFADWLAGQSFQSSRLLWLCDYACRDDYGLRLDETSAWAGLFYFCSRLAEGGAESQSFITFPEGNGRFVHYFASTLNDKITPSELAVSITQNNDYVTVTTLSEGGLRRIRCKRLIYCAPIFTASWVIKDFQKNSAFDPTDFQHNAWWVANLTLSERPQQRSPKDFPPAWDNVLYESPSLGYVSATHQSGIDYGPTVITYYYPMGGGRDARQKLLSMEWKDLAEVCLSDLELAHPNIREITERLDIMRWGHAMISPRPRFIWSANRLDAARPLGRIHFAHTDLSGVALFEEAFYHGRRAALEIINSLGKSG